MSGEGSAPAGVDLERLAPWLEGRVPGWRADAPVRWRLLAGGRSNVSYQLTQDDRSWVLRRPPLGHVMETAHDMSREHQVLAGLARSSFPAPRPVVLCEDQHVIGAPFLIMEFVDARVVADARDAASLTAEAASEVCDALVGTLVDLHRLDVERAGLAALGRPEGYVERQVARWRRQWAATASEQVPDLERLATWLQVHVEDLPAGMPWSLVHGDYRLDNVMLHHLLPQVVAVLDWEMATLGDPVCDLAVALVYWSRPGESLRHAVPVADGVTDGPGFWSRERLVEEYARRSGFPLDHLDLALALACFKLAVIMESIHVRTVQGQQLGAATESVDMHAATLALARLGMEVVSGAGLEGLSA